ncbi:hypothetical protein [Streptomyces azureus]|uniref:Uncharacterized protein n=1 Tax=Streptomyces azureus TaxID=146537 RepID=A0A0K8PL92_STRAJ|nr:hypothetical protein [Streptomyces azureus]GAP48652.1 putative uncharacterized protein [Streptomyces azureus]
MSENDYCLIDATRPPRADGPPYAMGVPPLERSREWGSVLCREATEYPESYKGITLCPVCMGVPPVRAKSRTWGRQEAQRTACSG